MIRRRVYKNGNSWVVSIPGNILEDMGMREGDFVEMELTRDRKLVMTRRSKDWLPGRTPEIHGPKG